MAAIAYPSAPFVWQRPDPRSLRAPGRPALRALSDLPEHDALQAERESAAVIPLRTRARTTPLRRARRSLVHQLMVWTAPIAVLAGTYVVSSAVASSGGTHYTVLPGSTPTGSGYRYTVQSGDSIWSIATRLDPTGDPRPLADQIQVEIGSSTLQPGTRILLP